MIKRRIIYAFLFLLVFSVAGFAQASWVALGKGMDAYRKTDLSQAMEFFQTARRSKAIYPEADYAIGLVYDAELNFDLAERYYKQALSDKGELANLEDAYFIQYRLARLYWIRRDNVAFERILQDIVQEDALFADENDRWFRDNSLLTFMRNGVDTTLLLYRREQTFSFSAHRELGIYYTIAGRDSAVEHVIMALIQAVSPLIRGLQLHQPLYEFTTLEVLLDDVVEYPELSTYIRNSSLYRILYFLGEAAYSFNPQSPRAREIWQLLSSSDGAGRWAARAQSAIIKPGEFYITDYSPQFP